MRCDDVIRELAVPTPGRDSASLAAHLAACPQCAHWAERDATVMRLWQATRPAEPSEEAWDALWCCVCDGLDRVEPARPLQLVGEAEPRGWRRYGQVAFLLAQAAAILAVAVLLPRTPPGSSPRLTPPVPVAQQTPATAPASSASPVEVDIDPGEYILIHETTKGYQRVELALETTAAGTGIDDNLLMLNALESMAE